MPSTKEEKQTKGAQAPVQEVDDFAKAYDETIRLFKEGQIVKGTVIAVKGNHAIVDIGYKSEGEIALDEFDDPQNVKVGDAVEVLLESKENEDGAVVLSRRKATRAKGWQDIVSRHREGDLITGKVIKEVKGGLIVDVGAEAFLPASQISFRMTRNISQNIGQEFTCKILKINRRRKNIVISRREYLMEEREKKREKVLAEIQVGQLRKGVVKNVTDFGAFVDLGGVDGLLHVKDMSWGRVSHPSELVKAGDEIEVIVLNYEPSTNKIALGTKQKTASPWENIEEKFPVNSKVRGRVVNLVPYGAFVELEKGVEGLVHISEFSWTRRVDHPSQVLSVGDVVDAMVLTVDKESQKISLGLKQIEPNPWNDIDKRYPAGTIVTGTVRNVTDYGAFVELENGIDGLLHISDMSWTRKLNHPSEVLKKGETIQAKVIAADPKAQKLSLGTKQLIEDPWKSVTEHFPVDTLMEGRITKITTFGFFVELEKDVEGLVHISEIGHEPSVNLHETHKVGDTVKARVIRIDNDERRIGLSIKQVASQDPGT